MKFLTKQKQNRADNKSGGAQKVMSFFNFLQMPALGVRCLYSHKWNLTPKLCSFGTWHSFLEKSMLNGGTLIQANQGQIKAFKKAMYDYETPTNRFFGSKLVEFNMPYVSRAILWIGPEKSTVREQSSWSEFFSDFTTLPPSCLLCLLSMNMRI